MNAAQSADRSALVAALRQSHVASVAVVLSLVSLAWPLVCSIAVSVGFSDVAHRLGGPGQVAGRQPRRFERWQPVPRPETGGSQLDRPPRIGQAAAARLPSSAGPAVPAPMPPPERRSWPGVNAESMTSGRLGRG